MPQCLKRGELSLSRLYTWNISPFYTLVSQHRSSRSFQTPFLYTSWEDAWRIKLKFTHQPPETQPNVQRQEQVINPAAYVGQARRTAQLGTYDVKIIFENKEKIYSFRGRHMFSISVVLDKKSDMDEESGNQFIILNSSSLNSHLSVDCSEDWLLDENLKLFVRIEFFPDPPTEISLTTSSFERRFSALNKEEKLHDFIILVDGQELKTNKTMLALTSPVFLAMFSHDFKETQEQRVCIRDTDLPTMKQFLHFAYTGQIPDFVDMASAIKLFHLAEKYQVSDLKQICLRYLRELTADENCFTKMILSIQPAI